MTTKINNQLIKYVTEKEIEIVLNDMNLYKAPGPNGFSTFLFQVFWHHIKMRWCMLLNNFFTSSILPNSWNRTFITLISKKDKMSYLNDFRSINLCNFIYKLVAKTWWKDHNLFFLPGFLKNKGRLFKAGV